MTQKRHRITAHGITVYYHGDKIYDRKQNVYRAEGYDKTGTVYWIRWEATSTGEIRNKEVNLYRG